MRLYDRTTGGPREVEVRPRMGVYVCGITPYDAAHMGHAFTYTHFDVLVRYLRHLGSDVVHVQNVTDVDDDMLRVARERGVDYLDLAERETAAFDAAMRAIRVSEPTHSPRATAYVPAIVEEVETILGTGRAYVRGGHVYFRVAADRGYGQLSGLSRADMQPLAAERGGHPEDPNKDDPLDFVLWQPSAPDEPRWDSPWGPGRPGWHIECSTMARRLLGQPVDVHGGGSDLVYPHHESELAQAEALPGERPFVRHWVHAGTVAMTGEKMSKSLGNLAFVQDLLDRHDPLAIREHLVRRHYREDWEFREEEIEPVDRVGRATGPDDGPADRGAFYGALDRDLDTPEALRVLDRAEAAGDAALVEEGRALLGLDRP